MDNIIVRLLELKINNLKNVENGIINFINSGIDKTLNLKYGDVLGIYGQNGSGKTTVIEALEILKNLLIGTPLDTELKNLITYGKKEANLSFKFYIEIDNKKYIIVYEVKLEKDEKEKVEVSNEIIKYSLYENDSWKKMQLLVEIPYSDIAIKPKKYFKDIFEKNILIKFMVAQGLSKELGMSFLFSDKAKEFLYSNNELKDILTALEYYGKMNLFIVSNKDIGLITLNLILPLKVKRLNWGRITY